MREMIGQTLRYFMSGREGSWVGNTLSLGYFPQVRHITQTRCYRHIQTPSHHSLVRMILCKLMHANVRLRYTFCAALSRISTTWLRKACCIFRSSFESSCTPKSPPRHLRTTSRYFPPTFDSSRRSACMTKRALTFFGSLAYMNLFFSSVIAGSQSPISKSTTPRA